MTRTVVRHVAIIAVGVILLTLGGIRFDPGASATNYPFSSKQWLAWGARYNPVRVEWKADFTNFLNDLQSLQNPTTSRIHLTQSDLQTLDKVESSLRKVETSPSVEVTRLLKSTLADQQMMILSCDAFVSNLAVGDSSGVNACVSSEQLTAAQVTKLGKEVAKLNNQF